jgi:hypothetical protein
MAPSSRNKRNEDGEEYTGIEERINHQRTNPKSPPDIQSHVADSHSGSAVDNEDSSDDDDIGPQLYTQPVARPPVTRSDNELDSQGTLKGDIPVKRRRDDWMVLPPDKGSPSSDRLKLRNRKLIPAKMPLSLETQVILHHGQKAMNRKRDVLKMKYWVSSHPQKASEGTLSLGHQSPMRLWPRG